MRTALVASLGLAVLLMVCSGCPKTAAPSAPSAEPPKMPANVEQPKPPATAATADLGKQIFDTGMGENGQHIAFTEGSDKFKADPKGCAGCHGEDGHGRKLSKGEIPAIHYSALRGGATPLFPSDESVAKAVREGLDEAGEPLSKVMPRWKLTDAEATAVLGYLKQLDNAPPAPAEAKPDAKPGPSAS